MDLQDYLDNGDQLFIRNISIDIAVLGFQDNKLKVLLSDFNGRGVLQGGHIGHTESVNDAVVRIMEERTGLTSPFTKLFQVFGDKHRNFKNEFKKSVSKAGFKWSPDQWVNDRFITMAYFALVDIEKAEVKGSEILPICEWHPINDLPEMILDHKEIILELRRHLKEEVSLYPILHHLLPEKFTLAQLRSIHEIILEKKLDRSRFQQKILSLKLYERLPQLNKNTPGRKPFLYRHL